MGGRSGKILLISLIISLILVPPALLTDVAGQDEVSRDLEIPPNIYQKEELEGFDEKGDNLHLTIIFEREQDEVVRRINYYIVEEHVADSFNVYTEDVLEEKSLDLKIDLNENLDKDVVNTENTQMYIVISNPLMEGDDRDPENATARITLEYHVTEEKAQEGLEILGHDFSTGGFVFIIVDILVVIAVIIFTILAVSSLKKKSKDTSSFFSPKRKIYYVFRDAEGSNYYFSPEQYVDMYRNGRLEGYYYFGEAERIGGDVDVYASGASQVHVARQVEGGLDASSMEATAVDIESLPEQGSEQYYSQQSQN